MRTREKQSANYPGIFLINGIKTMLSVYCPHQSFVPICFIFHFLTFVTFFFDFLRLSSP